MAQAPIAYRVAKWYSLNIPDWSWWCGTLTQGGSTLGSCISAILFIVYLTSLQDKLQGNSLGHLAYADNLLISAFGRIQLSGVLNLVENWANYINKEVNKSKSAIMELKLRQSTQTQITFVGYPLVY